jgi:hypothetical protein
LHLALDTYGPKDSGIGAEMRGLGLPDAGNAHHAVGMIGSLADGTIAETATISKKAIGAKYLAAMIVLG